MSDTYPLVSIGIPTYNRAALIGRAVDSALQQSHPHVEVLISDNASTDGTAEVCEALAAQHERVRLQRQPHNLGPTANFNAVLEMARGQYFMWLGDDDWIDPNYVSRTLARFQADPQVALVSGTPVYYSKGVRQGIGRQFHIDGKSALNRMLSYYWQVSDNGIFYGLMRRQDAMASPLRNVMGGDWLFVASLALRGKIVMLEETCVYRELGGATSSFDAIARVQGLPASHARYPFTFIASASASHLASGRLDGGRSLGMRWLFASCAFTCILAKAARTYLAQFVHRRRTAALRNS
jgi:glycosyltransferase involved in cell wall biosynthesis